MLLLVKNGVVLFLMTHERSTMTQVLVQILFPNYTPFYGDVEDALIERIDTRRHWSAMAYLGFLNATEAPMDDDSHSVNRARRRSIAEKVQREKYRDLNRDRNNRNGGRKPRRPEHDSIRFPRLLSPEALSVERLAAEG
jgi:hypothetical protein